MLNLFTAPKPLNFHVCTLPLSLVFIPSLIFPPVHSILSSQLFKELVPPAILLHLISCDCTLSLIYLRIFFFCIKETLD